MYEVYDRYLGWRQKTDRRPPSARAPADIEEGAPRKGAEPRNVGVEEADQEAEGKYLAVMKVSRELEVEKAGNLRSDVRTVLQEENERASLRLGKQRALTIVRRAVSGA